MNCLHNSLQFSKISLNFTATNTPTERERERVHMLLTMVIKSHIRQILIYTPEAQLFFLAGRQSNITKLSAQTCIYPSLEEL